VPLGNALWSGLHRIEVVIPQRGIQATLPCVAAPYRHRIARGRTSGIRDRDGHHYRPRPRSLRAHVPRLWRHRVEKHSHGRTPTEDELVAVRIRRRGADGNADRAFGDCFTPSSGRNETLAICGTVEGSRSGRRRPGETGTWYRALRAGSRRANGASRRRDPLTGSWPRNAGRRRGGRGGFVGLPSG
jgi:hypothetical protein